MTERNEIQTPRTIHINQDGVWAGSGTLDDLGYIQDCFARLGPLGLPHATGEAQEAAERAYAAIEEAIRQGGVDVTIEGCRYTWTIVEEDEEEDES